MHWKYFTYLFAPLLVLLPSSGVAETRSVNCAAGETIAAALKTLKPGDTLRVSGTCVENIEITEQLDGITLDGQGTATIRGSDSSRDTIRLVGVRGGTIQGFRITGGRDGLQTRWVTGLVLIQNNTIEQTGRNGIQLTRSSYAHIANNAVRNNPRNGIEVQDSRTRIGGSLDEPPQSAPNTIEGNGGHGIVVSRGSVARINGNTIRNSGQHGIFVEKMSQADVASNVIEGSAQDGILATQNSGVNLGADTGSGFEQSPNTTAVPNGQYGIEITDGAYADGRLGSLTGVVGQRRNTTDAKDSLLPESRPPSPSIIRFEPASVRAGGSFNVTVAGENLSSQTYFDVRFLAPGSTTDEVAFNWQRGTTAVQAVSADAAAGTWTITGVRAHREPGDHTGPFVSMIANLTFTR
jgi:parallel beta-helix repeat protein